MERLNKQNSATKKNQKNRCTELCTFSTITIMQAAFQFPNQIQHARREQVISTFVLIRLITTAHFHRHICILIRTRTWIFHASNAAGDIAGFFFFSKLNKIIRKVYGDQYSDFVKSVITLNHFTFILVILFRLFWYCWFYILIV